jgi:hypothetical protein
VNEETVEEENDIKDFMRVRRKTVNEYNDEEYLSSRSSRGLKKMKTRNILNITSSLMDPVYEVKEEENIGIGMIHNKSLNSPRDYKEDSISPKSNYTASSFSSFHKNWDVNRGNFNYGIEGEGIITEDYTENDTEILSTLRKKDSTMSGHNKFVENLVIDKTEPLSNRDELGNIQIPKNENIDTIKEENLEDEDFFLTKINSNKVYSLFPSMDEAEVENDHHIHTLRLSLLNTNKLINEIQEEDENKNEDGREDDDE